MEDHNVERDRVGNRSELPDDDPAQMCARVGRVVTDEECLNHFLDSAPLRATFRLRGRCRDRHIDAAALGLVTTDPATYALSVAPAFDIRPNVERFMEMVDQLGRDAMRAVFANVIMTADQHQDEETASALWAQVSAHAHYGPEEVLP